VTALGVARWYIDANTLGLAHVLTVPAMT